MVNRLGVKPTPCQKDAAKDSRKVQYIPVAKLDLRWHKTNQVKTYTETFFVVNSATPSVILGAPAFLNGNQSAGNQSASSSVKPIGTEKQTTEQKRVMGQKQLEVARRREQERKEQEEKEAERRRQAALKK
ncbi:MAG: hypothetical protein Q9218_007657 [Villophora microphyllina]